MAAKCNVKIITLAHDYCVVRYDITTSAVSEACTFRTIVPRKIAAMGKG